MYNFSGVIFNMFWDSAIFLVCGIILMLIAKGILFREEILGKNEQQAKNGKKVVFIISVISFVCALISPTMTSYSVFVKREISMWEGTYKKEENTDGLNTSYCFEARDGQNIWFDMNAVGRRDIYEDDFKKGKRYRIYYTEDKNEIVRVEELN